MNDILEFKKEIFALCAKYPQFKTFHVVGIPEKNTVDLVTDMELEQVKNIMRLIISPGTIEINNNNDN